MQIQQVSVNGLFGIFDHVILLNMDQRITIIHGPNGFGKTAILRMLNGFFNSQYSVFRSIPFNKFQVEFDDGSSVEVINTTEGSAKTKKRECSIEFHKPHSKSRTCPLPKTKDSSDIDLPVSILDDIIPGLQRVAVKTWVYLPTGETLSLNEVIERFEDVIPLKIKSRYEIPDWLKTLTNNIHVRLIESQRLLNFEPIRSSRLNSGTSSMIPTVSSYSNELAKLIESKLAEYGTTSQSLDRTFPARVVQQQSSPDLTDEELRTHLNELEETRSRLIEVGLLDKDENSDFQIQPQSIDESTKNILSVYVKDVEKKLSVFDEIASKIELLRRIINNKFAYSYKEMNFSKDKGFVFKTHHPSSSDTDILSPTDLSSGEQHELVLLYELLFKVQPNSLVLIDEPELSLHVGWQAQFLKDLQEITKLANLDILMATHSPDIIQDRWDLTVELKGARK
ncbi:ATPase [Planktothrix sp. PCC 11201]|uniref:AAA family ATPase n=1 Tax=Planktothrix sp. PCC 11201 TaxID=1729650 RepID=UPI000911267C|nr:AAA family ATPase [Planktothrix sp. PCC 11201]SKB12104.1 ATPase [Planktothrix sp. PCC 11201]